MRDFGQDLSRVFNEKTCIVGIGNTLRNDDALGVVIAERLQRDGVLRDGLTVMNVEDVIENYVFRIAEGDSKNVLLVDSVQAEGAELGSVVFGKLDELEELRGGLSTHKLALSMAARVFKEYGKETYLLGIVPGNTDFGTEISSEALDSAEVVIDMIRTAGSRGK